MAVAGCMAEASPGTLAADIPWVACTLQACTPLLASRTDSITRQITVTGTDPTPTTGISIHSTIASGPSAVIRRLTLPGGEAAGDGVGAGTIPGCGVPGMSRIADSIMNTIGSTS